MIAPTSSIISELADVEYIKPNAATIPLDSLDLEKKIDEIKQHSLKHCSWIPRQLPLEEAMGKMWKNSRKAIVEQLKQEPTYTASLQDALPTVDQMQEPRPLFIPLEYRSCQYADKGRRRKMEDAYLCKECKEGMLTAVFDGHGGDEVAKQAKTYFEKNFESTLQNYQGNVHQTFELLFDSFQKEMTQNATYDTMGTTATVCFINTSNDLVYTASVGDSLAHIYRNINGIWKSIPLCPQRDWSNKHDAGRAALVLSNPILAEDWPKCSNAKELRFPPICTGSNVRINVSRALGNVGLSRIFKKQVTVLPEKQITVLPIFHKPKITVNQLQQRDHLLIRTDGVKVTEEETINKLQNYKPKANFAELLVRFALKEKNSTDNATAISIVLI